MTIEEQLAEILSRQAKLEEENNLLRESLTNKSGIGFADNVPQAFRQDDENLQLGGMAVARHVIVATRAAEEHSRATGNSKVVDPGGLVRNSGSNPLRD